MEQKGTIKKIFPAVQVTEKFCKREFVLTINEDTQYPQDILFQLTQSKCTLIDPFVKGDTITVGINLRGREWTDPRGKVVYFNTLEVWKITGKSTQQHSAEEPVTEEQPAQNTELSTEDDLPF